MAVRTSLIALLLAAITGAFCHEVPEEPPVWTHYARAGTAQLNQWGGLGFYRIKRIRENTFVDLRLLTIFITDETLATVRYKSSRKFDALPQFYRFAIISMRHSSTSNLTIRYHYNQGFGAFVFDLPLTHLTTELALSYDMSDYLHDQRKTSYLKGGLFWDLDMERSALALDFEYFHQISDVISGQDALSRYEISAEWNFAVRKGYRITLGYEQEFYISPGIQSVRSLYLAFGFKRPLPLKI